MSILNNFVAGLRFGDPQQYGRLEIRPVLTDNDFSLPLLTLEEALQHNTLEVTEIDETGTVPELKVTNKGDIDVILLEGETLIGAKQNRMVNSTTIVPARSEVVLPVTCVEQGRWGYRTRRFSAGGHVMYSSARAASHRAVADRLRFDRKYESDQREMWSDIGAKLHRMNMESETASAPEFSVNVLKQVFDATGHTVEESLRHLDGQVGFLAYIGDGFAGGDLFGSSDLSRREFHNLTRGYIVDSEDHGIAFPRIGMDEVLSEIIHSPSESYPAVGKGEEIRFGNGRIQGACRVTDDLISHIAVFPSE